MKLTFEVDTEDTRTTTRILYAIADLMETIDAEKDLKTKYKAIETPEAPKYTRPGRRAGE